MRRLRSQEDSYLLRYSAGAWLVFKEIRLSISKQMRTLRNWAEEKKSMGVDDIRVSVLSKFLRY